MQKMRQHKMFHVVIFTGQSSKQFAAHKSGELELTVEEFQAFLGIHIAVGLSQIKDYWSKSEVLATPWFPALMARDWFLAILRNLH